MLRKSRCRKHRRIQRQQLNNAGMSLVEVIVAITILSVVAVAVLHSITISMTYNAKARIRQEVTLSAESLMESFKGYDLEELKKQFTDMAGGGEFAGIQAQHYEVSGDDISGYTFIMSDMETDTGKTYDAQIQVVPGTSSHYYENRNKDSVKDAVFLGDSAWDNKALSKATDDFKNNRISDFIDYMQHGIIEDGRVVETLNIKGNPISADDVDNSYISLKDKKTVFTIYTDADGKNRIKASMTYTYRIENFPYYVKVYPAAPDDTYGEEETETESTESSEVGFLGDLKYLSSYPDDGTVFEVQVPFDESGTMEEEIYNNPQEAGLERLYIYYYPMYDLADKIVINNSTNLNIQCYMIKQRNPAYTQTRLGIVEGGYAPKVSGSSTGGGSLQLFHNLNENIGASGGVNPSPEISGFANGSGRGENYVTANELNKDKVLTYHITLEMKDKNGNLVTELESSMNEK